MDQTKPTPAAGFAGRVVRGLFFAAFLAAGLFFCALIVRETYQAAQSWGWTKSPATIVESRVEHRRGTKSPYRPIVRFRYTTPAGETRTSDTWRLKNGGYSGYGDADAVVRRYPVGAAVECRVDPKDATRAVLQAGNIWFAFA